MASLFWLPLDPFWVPVRAGRAIHTADGSRPNQFTQVTISMASAFSGLQWKRSCRYATTWFTMYPGFNQSQGRNTALCGSMPISFQAQAQFNSFLFSFLIQILPFSWPHHMPLANSSPTFPEVGVDLNTYFSTYYYYITHVIILLAWEKSPVARETRRRA